MGTWAVLEVAIVISKVVFTCFYGSTIFGKPEESVISSGVGINMVPDKVFCVVLRNALRILLGAQRAIIGVIIILEN